MPPENPVKILSEHLAPVSFSPEWYILADESHFWMQWRLAAFLKQLKTLGLLTQNLRYGLEIGCGQGILRAQLEKHTSWNIDGVDLDIESLKRAKGGRGELHLYDVREKRKEFEKKYDFLVLFDVLEHIADTGSFLNACLYHLRPGGYIFVNVPAVPALLGPYDRVLGHLRRYNKKNFQDEFEQQSVEIIDMRYWALSLIPFLWLRNVLTFGCKDRKRIIETGFKPRNPLVHAAFKTLMRFENRFLAKPFCGASLLAIAKRI